MDETPISPSDPEPKRHRSLAEIIAEAREAAPHISLKKFQWEDSAGWFCYFE